MFIVTYVCILTSNRSTTSCRDGFDAVGTLSYCATSEDVTPIVSAHCLSPDHFRREFARWVSYYALFKWWLPLSQHPHCLCEFTSFSTEQCLGALTDGLGCFPLDYEAYPPQSDCRTSPDGIRSLIEFSTLVWALAHSVLYLRRSAFDAIPQYISERTSYHQV